MLRHQAITDILISAYPNAGCELNYKTPFELLVAVILSAQCTDKRVNQVTNSLFSVASTPEEFVNLPIEQLEKLIFSCGFYKSKAAAIKSASADIVNNFGGVPDSMDKMLSLRGVGRKTANVILSVAFGQDAVAVDTHVFRVSRRLGFSDGKTPDMVEKDLLRLFDGDGRLSVLHHALIFHGRYCCHSQKPSCTECPVEAYCANSQNQNRR